MIDHYPVKFKQTGPPVDPAVLDAVENDLRVKFPRAYRELLLANNGGVPSPGYIPYPGQCIKISRFYSLDELRSGTSQHRTENGLPDSILPIAKLGANDASDTFLLLQCGGAGDGALFSWVDAVECGFRKHAPDYDNVNRLYLTVDQLLKKFGPATSRQDQDGLFCQLYYASSNATQGSRLATKYVANEYDINFVLPTFRHPIFSAIDSEAFGVVCTFLRLGANKTHVDPLHGGALVLDRLLDEQQRWENLLHASIDNKHSTAVGMTRRRLANIAEAIKLVEEAD